MIKYVRKNATKLTNAEWDTFFTNFNNNIVKSKISTPDPKLQLLKDHANEVGFPILTSFDISGRSIVPTPTIPFSSGDHTAHNNAITELSTLVYLVNLHYIGNKFPGTPGGSSSRIKIHMSDIFLPWHRMYLIHFEQLLGSPAHYWNWYEDQQIPQKLKISNLQNVIEDISSTKVYEHLNRNTEDLTAGGLGITRTQFRATFKANWRSLFRSGTIDSFHQINELIEYNMHNNIHIAVAGDAMGNINVSPYDPVFWFHHSFVDKIWADFHNTLSGAEKSAITDYPTNDLPFFTQKTDAIVDVRKDLMISFQGLFKNRNSL